MVQDNSTDTFQGNTSLYLDHRENRTNFTNDTIFTAVNSTDNYTVSTSAEGLNVSSTECLNDYCVSNEEYIDMIHNYIRPTPFEWCLIGAYFWVFVIGLVGNFLVCFAVWRNHSMRTVTNYFIGKL